MRKNDFEMSEFDNQKINGIYDIGIVNNLTKNLWITLKSIYTHDTDTINLENHKVKLTLLDSENLNVQLLRQFDNGVIKEFKLQGKIKGNFFTIDRKLTLYPFFPVFYVNKETKTILGNDLKGDLVLVTGRVSEAMILLMGGGSRKINNNKFNRENN